MLKYLETNFGERALNGDMDQIEQLQVKIKAIEAKLEVQKSKGKGQATKESESDKHSEHETDSDVSDTAFANFSRHLTITSKYSLRRLPTKTVAQELQCQPKPLAPGTRRDYSSLRLSRKQPSRRQHCVRSLTWPSCSRHSTTRRRKS